MKRLAVFLLALCMLLTVAGCAENADDTSSALSTDTTSDEASSEPEIPPAVYTIVYKYAYEDEAKRLAEAVSEATGLEYPCTIYTNGMELPEHTIFLGVPDSLVGEEGQAVELAPRDFAVSCREGSIYCRFENDLSASAAVDYLLSELMNDRGFEQTDGIDYYYDHPYPLENAKINGVELADFTIIYAPTENEAKYSSVAKDFKDYLYDNANVRVPSYGQTKEASENEIIIGIAAGRELVAGEKEYNYDYNSYRVTVSGGNAAVVGGTACAAWHGCMALVEALKNAGEEGIGDCVIDGTCELVKVSCVGDSITEGVNSTDFHVQSYPVYLQEMLGYDYYVKNHGLSGYSVVFTDEYSYSKSYRYIQAKRFEPDVVIYMLGTNDCNPGQDYKDWTDGSREAAYREDTIKYFNAFRAINPDVQIFMCIPPTLCESTVWPWEEWAARIEAHTAVINREIAEEQGLPIVDMFSWSKEHPEVFPDGLHPYNETYKTYAQRVYDEIKDTIKKPGTADANK